VAFSSAETGAELPMWRHGSVKRDSSAQTDTWKTRLTDEEVERVERGTAEVAKLFYGGATSS
jgi:hypothetical protein